MLQRIDAQYPPHERGDALVFVSGVEEIERLAEPLRAYAASGGRWVVLPLHASLPVAEQAPTFATPPLRQTLPPLRQTLRQTLRQEASLAEGGAAEAALA